jgi:hypothetical protein
VPRRCGDRALRRGRRRPLMPRCRVRRRPCRRRARPDRLRGVAVTRAAWRPRRGSRKARIITPTPRWMRSVTPAAAASTTRLSGYAGRLKVVAHEDAVEIELLGVTGLLGRVRRCPVGAGVHHHRDLQPAAHRASAGEPRARRSSPSRSPRRAGTAAGGRAPRPSACSRPARSSAAAGSRRAGRRSRPRGDP